MNSDHDSPRDTLDSKVASKGSSLEREGKQSKGSSLEREGKSSKQASSSLEREGRKSKNTSLDRLVGKYYQCMRKLRNSVIVESHMYDRNL